MSFRSSLVFSRVRKLVGKGCLAAGLLMVSSMFGLPSPPQPSAAVVCGPACQLFDGASHLELDSRFQPSSEIAGHIETATVYFNGQWYMYYRTFRHPGGQCGGIPTGIALATSFDGHSWQAQNGGLPLPGLSSTNYCQDDNSTWKFAPDVVLDGLTLRVAYEVRTRSGGGRALHTIEVASSTDGVNWGSNRTIINSGGTGDWNSEVGTPDLLKHGSNWVVGFHANGQGHFLRALAQGGASFDDPFSNLGPVFRNQPPQQYPAPGWFGYGPGLGDIIFEGGLYYMIFEGFSGTGACGQSWFSTPRIGLARSADLINWTVSPYGPVQEISQNSSSCGHDMPNWQHLSLGNPILDAVTPGELTLVTTNDGLPAPQRWRIVNGAPQPPPPAAPDILSPNQYLGVGQQLTSGNGYTLVMQGDGNLVLYAPGNVPTWQSGTYGHPGTVAVMQDDGNLVMMAPGTTPLCSTGTWGNPGSILKVQTDGNLVIYRPGNVAIWAKGACN